MPDALLTEAPAYFRARSPQSSLAARVRAHLGLKLLLLATLSLVFCLPYFVFGFHPLLEPRRLRLSALDQIIPFDPRWTYVYQSLYLLIPISPFLATSREELHRYARTFVLMSIAGLSICILWPIECPRPSVPTAGGMYALITSYDPPSNAFPSMHMALATQALLMGLGMLHVQKSHWLWPLATLGTLWLIAIAYSTLAIKQHYAIDIPAGVLLAIIFHLFFGRRPMPNRRSVL